MAMTETERWAQINDYSKEHYRQYNFRVSRELDGDIMECIETMRMSGVSINAFIRECIRAVMDDENKLDEIIGKNESLKNARI